MSAVTASSHPVKQGTISCIAAIHTVTRGLESPTMEIVSLNVGEIDLARR